MRREGGGVKEVQGGTLQMPFSGFYQVSKGLRHGPRPMANALAKASDQGLGQDVLQRLGQGLGQGQTKALARTLA